MCRGERQVPPPRGVSRLGSASGNDAPAPVVSVPVLSKTTQSMSAKPLECRAIPHQYAGAEEPPRCDDMYHRHREPQARRDR